MPKVSIIMPSYNVAPYIRECMESVLNQTLRDLEVLCVDAFSTDGTREILEEYARRDSRVKILDDDRGSCGYADNLGIESAAGEYIGIVETDDYVAEDMFEKLYGIASENHLDYAKGDYNQFVSDHEGHPVILHSQVLCDGLEPLYGLVIAPSRYPELVWNDHCMWTGIYRREFLLENRIKYNETKGAAYQDHGFIWQTVCHAQRAMYVRDAFYYYRRDNEFCSMNNPHSLKMDYIEFEFIEEFLKYFSGKNSIHKWTFYKKLYKTFENDLRKYFKCGEEMNAEMAEYTEKYIKKLREGLGQGEIDDSQFYQNEWLDFRLLMEAPETFIQVLKSRALTGARHTQRILDRVSDSGETVIVGCGAYGTKLYWTLATRGIEKNVALCDNNPALWGTRRWGKEITSVETAVQEKKEALFITANSFYALDLWRQLIGLGVPEKQIMTYSNVYEEV